MRPKQEQRTIPALCTTLVFNGEELDESFEEINVDGYIDGGLLLHTAIGKANCYWNITHIQSGRRLLHQPKKYSRPAEAKQFLKYAATLQQWEQTIPELLRSGVVGSLDLLETYSDDRKANSGEEED